MVYRSSDCSKHALRWAAQIALGIHTLHEIGIMHRRVYTTSAVGTTYCMAPEVLRNVLDPDSVEYGIPVDWWSFGCVVYQLFSENHKALFCTMDDILNYVAWCSEGDRSSRQRLIFKDFEPLIAELLSGLLDPDFSTRYGFTQVVYNDALVIDSEQTHFSNAYSHAQVREDLPDSLPTIQYNEPSEVWACLLPWDIQRVPNVDWVKPNYEQ
ncbi:hypothetical protein CY34DRAFT_811696 [Suillus luteus UH-Slu-Lm8-n1]|uniref:non-specific serine/threonine protein kinase n=1 Tax=Suillus luteus UH-Slu-Lm8-n1 TaxID=930992 RepID=A0A0D0A2S2_9AGAM|nr:hypothetical protein CY34DRAFT_811696 [Suillus luteus UH-Slu-Lm8-n1]